MKWILLCSLVVTATLAQTDGPGGPYDLLDSLVEHEVIMLVTLYPGLTIEQCAAKCDAVFQLVISKHEDRTDSKCHQGCKQVLDMHGHGEGGGHHHHRNHTTTPSA